MKRILPVILLAILIIYVFSYPHDQMYEKIDIYRRDNAPQSTLYPVRHYGKPLDMADMAGTVNKSTGINTTSHNTSGLSTTNANAFIPLNIATYDRSNQLVHPDVVAIKNGFNGYRYWMAYTPYPYADDFYENPCIAASNDGIKWTTPKGMKNPIVPPPSDYLKGAHYSDTDLTYSDGTLSLLYVYNRRGVRGSSRFYRVQSKDGVSWSKPSILYETEPGISGYSPAIVTDNGQLHMWYVSDRNTMFYTKSKSDLKWETAEKCSLLIDGWTLWHVDVIKSDKGYEGLMCAINNKSFSKALFYINSTDGLTWQSSPKPILSPPENGWDNLDIYRATMVKINGVYRIWYSARNKKNVWGVGYTKGNDIQALTGYSIKLADYDLK